MTRSLADLRNAFWGAPDQEMQTLQGWVEAGINPGNLVTQAVLDSAIASVKQLVMGRLAAIPAPSGGLTADSQARETINAIRTVNLL